MCYTRAGWLWFIHCHFRAVAYTTQDRPVALFYVIRNIEVVYLPVAHWTFSSSSWFARLQQWTKSNVVVNTKVIRPAGDFHWSVIKLHALLAAVKKFWHAATASQKSFARWMPPTFSGQCSSAPSRPTDHGQHYCYFNAILTLCCLAAGKRISSTTTSSRT